VLIRGFDPLRLDLRLRRRSLPATRQFRQLDDQPERLVYGFLGRKCLGNIGANRTRFVPSR
jgi:hypothetical protein